ncbi:MAG: IS66 family transposase [Waltera sp.]|uniref:IS66 family transposase n=1 Tax=Waltera sp. TaxID=2815806 RepID=UPI0039938E46
MNSTTPRMQSYRNWHSLTTTSYMMMYQLLKKGKILALVERLANYKVSVCLFIHNFNVPFDNNQAERDLRMIKVKTKVSGCFRTEEGARDYLKIMSYVGTAHKQGHNAYQAIKNAISGHPDFIFE